MEGEKMNNREKALLICAALYGGLFLLEQRRIKAENKLNELQAAVIVRSVVDGMNIPKPKKWWELWK